MPDTPDDGVHVDTSNEMAFVADVHAIVCALIENCENPDMNALFRDLKAIRSGAEELINAAENADD